MTEAEARRIAGEWHGGQSSPLYAFASSGSLSQPILDEIEQNLTGTDWGDVDHKAYKELQQLQTYVESRIGKEK